MKKIIRIFMFVCLMTLLPFSAFAEEVTVTVKGMVCSFCAQGMKKTFGKLEGIEKVDVDLENKLVVLEIKDAQVLSDQDIEKTINDAGYDVLKIERKKDA